MQVRKLDRKIFTIELKGESSTLTQLINREMWDLGGEGAAIQEHPFIEEPKIVVESKNPKKLLERVAKRIQEQCDEFKNEFQKAMKK
ncbi:MAG: DNA-directed RNA polymerase subunit L [Candidatus Aenigmarchaeota archaeon]|nr:DNA-directed RNA polymerase subunit L [Candidatus Aenigmarchaeota archaeon]